MAGLRLAVSWILASLCFSSLCAADDVKVFVQGVTSIAKTDDNFICATLDWWPSEKCDYNQCPWGKAGLLNLVCLLLLLLFVNFFAAEYSY
jgi:heparanase 1